MNPVDLILWALALGAVILIAAVCLVVTVAAVRSVKTKPKPQEPTQDGLHIVGGGHRD